LSVTQQSADSAPPIVPYTNAVVTQMCGGKIERPKLVYIHCWPGFLDQVPKAEVHLERTLSSNLHLQGSNLVHGAP